MGTACAARRAPFVAVREAVWIVEPQYGIVVESAIPLGEFFDGLASSAVFDGRLRAPLLHQWLALGGALPAHCVLCPRPALALGGEWNAHALAVMLMPVYLLFTAGLFNGDMPVTVERATDG